MKEVYIITVTDTSGCMDVTKMFGDFDQVKNKVMEMILTDQAKHEDELECGTDTLDDLEIDANNNTIMGINRLYHYDLIYSAFPVSSVPHDEFLHIK